MTTISTGALIMFLQFQYDQSIDGKNLGYSLAPEVDIGSQEVNRAAGLSENKRRPTVVQTARRPGLHRAMLGFT
jgi:hypothetical protein